MATYYVDMSAGANTNAGTSAGAGNAWKTIARAMDVVVGGDKVWVKASAEYTNPAIIATAGASNAPITFEGYTTTTGDGGRATMNTTEATRCLGTSYGLAANTAIYYVFKNFRFTGAIADGVNTDCNNLTFKNCKFDTNGTNGITARLSLYEACEFSSNTGAGCVIDDGGGCFLGCRFYSNGGNGLTCQSNTGVVLGCTFFSNAGNNMKLGGTDMLSVVYNCTCDGDGKDSNAGISWNGTGHMAVAVNTVLYDCGIGLDSPGGNMGERVISRNNLVNANTTAYTNAATFTGEVTSAPAFVNEVGGADYTPAAGSPLINAGLNG